MKRISIQPSLFILSLLCAGVGHAQTAAVTGPSEAAGTLSSNSGIAVRGSAIIKGPNPWRDISAYGARPVSVVPSTTATCRSGSSTVTLTVASSFQNGDGVVLHNCGTTPAMATPSPPSVQAGNSITLTVPESALQTLRGSSTYLYKIIGHDLAGGLSLPSAATTTTTGAASLGQQTVAVTSESLTGSTLTVVTAVPHNLSVNTLVHIEYSTNAALSTWANVTGVTNGTTFTISNMTVTAKQKPLTSTGGTLTFYVGNRLTWAYSAGAWEYYICASRPADAGAYHLIGVSYPYNTLADNNGAGSLIYTDWGSVLSSAPRLPAYATDAACTAGRVTNDYLSTTITSGAGTTTLVLAANATNNSAGKAILFDDAPAFAAAAAAEASSGSNSQILIPPTPNFSFYVISSVLNMNFPRISIHQQGNVLITDTVIGPSKWMGDPITASTNNSFSLNQTALVSCVSGWPCIYVPPVNAVDYEYLTLNNLQTPSNQSLGLLVDGNAFNGTRIRHMNFSSGDTSDFSGISLVTRPANFLVTYDDLGFNGGPGQSYTDRTWTPTMWVMHALGETGTTQLYTISNVSGTTRGIYATSYGHSTGPGGVSNIYIQGTIMPALTLQNFNGTTAAYGDYSGIHNDTSSQPNLAILGGPWPIAANISFGGGSGGIEPSGSYAPLLVGTAPTGLSLGGNLNNTPGFSLSQYPISYTGANVVGNYNYFSNNGEAILGSKQVTYNFYSPLMSQTGMFVPVAVPYILTSSVSAGGTATCCGAQTYSVIAVGPNGGWSAASTVTLITSASNRTINLTWAAVPGAVGYHVMENGNKCVDGDNCLRPPVTGTSMTYSGGAGCCYNVAIPDAPGDGIAGFNSNGLFGAQAFIIPAVVAALPAAAAANAGMLRSVSDSTAVANEGQTCVGGSTNKALAFSNGVVWKCF